MVPFPQVTLDCVKLTKTNRKTKQKQKTYPAQLEEAELVFLSLFYYFTEEETATTGTMLQANSCFFHIYLLSLDAFQMS